MPASLAHHLFAKAALAQYGSRLAFLSPYSSLVSIGSQGPDPFYFYGSLPWRKHLDTETINGVGSMMHSPDPLRVLPKLIEEANQLKGQDRDIAFAYVYGSLMHYTLDRNVHPFVFYQSGFDESGKLTPPYNADHSRYESLMDVSLMRHFKASYREIHPYRSLLCPNAWITIVSELHHRMFPTLLSKTHFAECLADMRSVLKFLFRRHGLRRVLVKRLMGERSMSFSMAHPVHIPNNERYDYLNLEHRTWFDPSTGSQHSTSVIDMFQHALAELETPTTFLKTIYDGGIVTNATYESFFRSINYDGQQPTAVRRYFHSIYPSMDGKRTFYEKK